MVKKVFVFKTVEEMIKDFGAAGDGLPKVMFGFNYEMSRALCNKIYVVDEITTYGKCLGKLLDTQSDTLKTIDYSISLDMLKPFDLMEG